MHKMEVRVHLRRGVLSDNHFWSVDYVAAKSTIATKLSETTNNQQTLTPLSNQTGVWQAPLPASCNFAVPRAWHT